MNAKSGGTISKELMWPNHINKIPKEIFGDPAIFEMELERIFYGPEWHLVGHVAELPNKGDFKTFDLGRRPILIARGEDDRVRIFTTRARIVAPRSKLRPAAIGRVSSAPTINGVSTPRARSLAVREKRNSLQASTRRTTACGSCVWSNFLD